MPDLFEPLPPVLAVRWRELEQGGREELQLTSGPEGFTARGVIGGGPAGASFSLEYTLRCDGRWRTRQLTARPAGAERGLALSADGEGRWSGADGRPLPELDGCLDVDVAATPFTNTLPIRRLGLRPGERAELRVAYLAVPELAVSVVRQTYLCLEAGRRYRYAGYPEGFQAELTVDRYGLVTLYPGLFERVG